MAKDGDTQMRTQSLYLLPHVRTLHQTCHTTVQKFLETSKPPSFQFRKQSYPEIQEIYIQSTVLILFLNVLWVFTAAWAFRLLKVTGPGCRICTLGSSSSIIRKIKAANKLNAVPWVKEKHVPRVSPRSSLAAFNTPTTSLRSAWNTIGEGTLEFDTQGHFYQHCSKHGFSKDNCTNPLQIR